MIEANMLIKASAGTGKTFALATRFIRLMLIDGVKPETIVALTFSRAAAQEIYTKILIRLCEASESDARAEAEWENLLADFKNGDVPQAAEKFAAIRAKDVPHDAAVFRALLRRLVDTQHLGAIATLDSFILRIVRNFPKEMGFQNAVEVLDPADESDAVDAAVSEVLARTDGFDKALADAYVTAKRGENVRTCLKGISYILNNEGWRNFVIANPACAKWTVESMSAALGVDSASACPDLSGLPFNDVGKRKSPEESFAELARSYDGSGCFLPSGDAVTKLMRFFWEHPDATSYDYSFYGKQYVFSCGAEGAAAVRGAIRHMVSIYLKRQLEIVKAKIDLVLAVEGAYDRATRRAGKLTFGDFTKYSAENEFSSRGIAIKNVEFRFDSRFDHWALDEFQDTSELQWRCLKELVRNAADAGRAGEPRTAMAVGDLKQSIYTWRGASARPFDDIAGWEAFAGCARDFRESHRYGPNIAEFVNCVFGHDNIAPGGIIPAACDRAVKEWADGWIDHVSHEKADYVKVVGAALDAQADEKEAILSALFAEVAALWKRHQEAKSGDTVGILVRSNDRGTEVAEHLRGKGLPIVWEGMNRVHDLPVVQAVLALLKLADHPEDTAAWRTANDLFDVRRVLLPECEDAASASAAVARLLSRQGIARTLKDFCGTLREGHGLATDGLSGERLRQLVEMGVAFEGRRQGGGSADEFVRFLEKSEKRELAVSSDVIRVLTIHRSKGLGFDHVFVPLFEGERWSAAIDGPKMSAPLFDGGDWVLGHLKRGCEQFNEKTRAAFGTMRCDRLKESLRTHYVALTRAKKSMVVIVPDDHATADLAKGVLIRDLVVRGVCGALPYEKGTPPPMKAAEEMPTMGRELWEHAGKREQVERVSPSAATHGAAVYHKTADALFAEDFGAAVQRGIDVHARYESVEWANESELAAMPEAFRPAFSKPSGDASVWREKSYEIFVDGRWETGQFDRVVFAGAGATIYDFKTNALRAGEDAAAFAERMRGLYSPQMAAYRSALSRLTGIAPERIACVLLLEATGGTLAV